MLSGYKFVSFRIFSFTIIRIEGRLRLKRFDVAGTGGQCLLTPPERKNDYLLQGEVISDPDLMAGLLDISIDAGEPAAVMI